jgi:hypothetical protein
VGQSAFESPMLVQLVMDEDLGDRLAVSMAPECGDFSLDDPYIPSYRKIVIGAHLYGAGLWTGAVEDYIRVMPLGGKSKPPVDALTKKRRISRNGANVDFNTCFHDDLQRLVSARCASMMQSNVAVDHHDMR